MGMVGPGEFIPLAEYLGLINPIGDFVLRKACEKCKYWNDMGHPEYRINVNLSVVQLLQNDIVERIRTVLEETKMRPENLTLEVTESLAINDIGRMKKVLSKIKELGALIALDDFGTGYSSLSLSVNFRSTLSRLTGVLSLILEKMTMRRHLYGWLPS